MPSEQTKPSKGAILVVDDTHENLRLLAGILKEDGYAVRLAPNGHMALASAQANPPSLILLDIMMPGLDGYAVCEALKKDACTSAIPIIFISALNEVFDKVRAFSIGGVDYITKPFQVEEVLIRVKTHLTLRAMHKSLEERNVHMQQEIARRQEAEDLLQQKNEDLHRLIVELQIYNREITLLNALGELLQTCMTIEDAYNVAAEVACQLFEDQSGALYMNNASVQTMQAVITWGDDTDMFETEVCSCVAKQLKHHIPRMVNPYAEPQCAQLHRTDMRPYLCVPLIAQRENLGVMHLIGGPMEPQEANEHWVGLALMMCSHLALALKNIQLRDQLREQSIRDPLTGLFNRRYLNETLEREISRASRYEYPLGIIMLDIDHFKQFNDTYGHDGGDTLLRAIGTFLQNQTRREDIACRYGGEEFTLILPSASLQSVQKRAEDICVELNTLQVQHNERPLGRVTASLGVALFPDHGMTADDVIVAADKALYRAKKEGRNRVITAP